MSEPRDLALVRNAIALLSSLDRHEIEPISDVQWLAFRRYPWTSFLALDDHQRARVWAALQERLPTHLREDAADQLQQERLREFVRPDCPRCGAEVKRVEPTNPAAGVKASVTYACGCIYADEDLDDVVRAPAAQSEGAIA